MPTFGKKAIAHGHALFTMLSFLQSPLLLDSVHRPQCEAFARKAQTPAKEAVSVDLLITGGKIVTMDAYRRVIENGAIAVRGDTIIAIGPRDFSFFPKGILAKQTIDARGKLSCPA